jgi:membrane-associated PAP2 superfamily phosphatase
MTIWKHWSVRLLVVPLLVLSALVIALHESPVDRAVLSLFYDPDTRTFPARYHWFFTIIVHEVMKIAVIVVGVLALGVCLAGLGRPRFVLQQKLKAWHRPALLVALAIAIGPALVGWLKSISPRHCPWDLQLYGGTQPWVSLWDPLPEGAKPGKCFPGGHASGGYALVSLWFATRPTHPQMARKLLVFALCYGSFMGLARCAMGAHFPSHICASLLVAWTVCVLVARLVYPAALGIQPANACNRA